jgi:four helix bundle protein
MRFKKLEVWQRGKALSVDIYRYFSEHPDFGFRDQITRSGLSIPSNIAEGYERSARKERARFLAYAKGSSGELHTQILIGYEIGYIDSRTANRWGKETEELSRMIQGLIQALP